MRSTKDRFTFDKRRLRLLLLTFLLLLAIPTGVVIYQAHGRVKWEAFHQQRTLAEELAARIDGAMSALVDAEEGRAFTDYRFLVVAGDPSANFIQRSPLSNFPVSSPVPGTVGYFQLEPDGSLTTPMLPPAGTDPATYGIATAELEARGELDARIRSALIEATPAVEPREDMAFGAVASPGVLEEQRAKVGGLLGKKNDKTVQSVFDLDRDVASETAVYNTAKLKDELDDHTATMPRVSSAPEVLREAAPSKQSARYAAADSVARTVRKEQSAVLEPEAAPPASGAPAQGLREAKVRMFESEVEPMSFARLDARYFVLFRNVWRDGQRYIQGALIEQKAFLQALIEAPFRDTALSTAAGLSVAYSGEPLHTPDSVADTTETLYRTRLAAPLGAIELVFSLRALPLGPGADVIVWTAVILGIVLCGGFFALYRLGASQIELNRQQQDFVAAVSHELKTPLTSIRMYGEMLREGWADEGKKRGYYDFIFDESERLSRLITNVLRLSRLGRTGDELELKAISVGELMDNARSKVTSAIQRAGFELIVDRDPAADGELVLAEADAFCQIVINLVDNALKFAARAERKEVVLSSRLQSNRTVLVSVRDFGPGVPKKQMKRIFELFYRGENELTRETVGTGIGLALVRQLATAMKGRVDVRNCDPGAEVFVVLPTQTPDL